MCPGGRGSCAGKACLLLYPGKTSGFAIIMAGQNSRVSGNNLLVHMAGAALCASLMLLYGCSGPTGYKTNREIASHGLARHEVTNHEEARTAPYYQRGLASYYGKQFQNKKTASGERFNLHSMTAAHKSLPFGTKVVVKNVHNGKTVKVRINDRGPFVKGRIIDLSKAAFSQIASLDEGLASVEIRIVK